MRGTKSVSLAAVAAAATLAATPVLADMNFSTGRQGGSQYPVTVALSQILEKVPGVGKISLVPGGGTSNVVAVNVGKSAMAISLSNSVYDGYKGNKPYPGKMDKLTQLWSLHGFKIVVLVPAESPIKSFKDLEGRKINVGPNGFGITTLAKELFAREKMKVNIQYHSPRQAPQHFKDGNVEGWMYSPSDRMAPFMNIASSRDVRAVPLSDSAIKYILDTKPSFAKATWPLKENMKYYPKLKNQIETVTYLNTIIANKDKVSDELAYNMTKALVENIGELAKGDPSLEGFQPKDLTKNLGVPIHPGAMKYFKEKGLI